MRVGNADLKLLKKILDEICEIENPAIKKRLMSALVAVVDKLAYEALHSQ